MPPLTQKELDETTAAHRAYRDEINRTVDAPPFTKEQLHWLGAYFRAHHKEIEDAAVPRFEALEKAVAELQSGALKYMGVYQPSVSYSRGSVVTHDGSAWHATRAVTAERPGGSDSWQLMVKHGKDAAAPRSETTTANPRQNGHYANPRPRPP